MKIFKSILYITVVYMQIETITQAGGYKVYNILKSVSKS